MERKIIEGTWEEMTRRAQEFAGHRVRVTVLEPLASPASNPIMGMFSDAPDLLDEVVEEAMKKREARGVT